MGSLGAAFDQLGVERAWIRTRGSPAVVIAIVGDGLQADHPLLGPNIHRDFALRPMSAEAYEIPGTHAAGVAAGRHSAVKNFSGVAPDARILPVRCNDRPGTQAFSLPEAVEYAAERGACVINIPHGASLSGECVRRALHYAATRNALVVCSVSPASAESESPADAPNLIRVLPVDPECRPFPEYRADLHGVHTNDGQPVGAAAHLAAPGFARVPEWRGSGHSELTAADIAAPYVSGCAALVKSLNPAWGYVEIKEHLLASGTAQAQLTGHCASGLLLNVAHAVLGPVEYAGEPGPLAWSALSDNEVRWTLRYRSALCVNVVALFRPNGDQHWRELASARAGSLRMTVPAAVLRRSSGILRLGLRESNFHADDIELTIR